MTKGVLQYIAVDIGGTKCAVSLADGSGTFIERRQLSTGAYDGPDPIVDILVGWARELSELSERTHHTLPAAVGISSGGPLNRSTGRILGPPNLPGWDDVPIVARFEEELDIPIFLENDANAGALAEWYFGAGRGYSNVVFLTFGTGMGAGLILNDQLYRGTNDLAGEVGHIRISDDGPAGYGKSGSFEGQCSGGGISRIARNVARETLKVGGTCGFCSDLSRVDSVTAKDVADAARQGDKVAGRIIENAARSLGRGLAILVDVLNPQLIIIGSVYTRNEELFKEIALDELSREALPGAVAVCKVVPSALGDQIGDYAALAVAIMGAETAGTGEETT
ncbi:MAG: ROK family protein [Alkalispirochaeta sp.]